MDFASDPTRVKMSLISGRSHFDRVVRAVEAAKLSVWIATANLKEMMIAPRAATGRRGGGRWRSSLDLFDELARRGVELRILHAAQPSRPFCQSFDRYPRLIRGGVDMRLCPRVHLKTVIVDARLVYLGSANWTGAGLGGKGTDKRNFELGLVSDDEALIDLLQATFARIWEGEPCASCKLRDRCEMPLDTLQA